MLKKSLKTNRTWINPITKPNFVLMKKVVDMWAPGEF